MSSSPGRLAMPRRRGTASGLLILLLGVWGALIPFVGPYFDWTVGSDETWDFSTARLLMQAAPGVAAIAGGLLLMGAANRGSGTLGAVLTIAGGAWFAIGPTLSPLGGIPDVGAPLGTGAEGALQALTLFTGLGALLCVLGGIAFGRVTARLEGDTDRLRATTAAPAGTERTQVHRDRAVVPPSRGDRDASAADTRVTDADTRVADRDASTADTRVTDRDTSADRAVPAAGTSASDTRVLGDRDTPGGTGDTTRRHPDDPMDAPPPPPDPNRRAG